MIDILEKKLHRDSASQSSISHGLGALEVPRRRRVVVDSASLDNSEDERPRLPGIDEARSNFRVRHRRRRLRLEPALDGFALVYLAVFGKDRAHWEGRGNGAQEVFDYGSSQVRARIL